jgi:hypothetical protein
LKSAICEQGKRFASRRYRPDCSSQSTLQHRAPAPAQEELMPTPDFGKQWHQTQLGTVDQEIARLASICQLRLLDPGIIERVLAGDETVCGRKTPKAFRKLRGLIGMHYALTNDSVQALGPEESARNLDSIRARLAKQFDIGGGR